MLFVVGGLARNWKDVRAVFYTIGMAGLVNLLSARIFAKEENGRLNMDASGTIGNSNDLAAHLIIVLPFILFISMDKKRNPLIRLAMVPLMGYGVSVILGTASRGALTALGVVFLFMIFRATPKQRALTVLAATVMAVASFAILPGATLSRLGSLFGQQHEEAEDSYEARSYLFWTSVQYTLQHPVVGVGLGQFPNFEGKTQQAEGKHGNWHATHCAWTEVSSECGLPALLFFALGIGSAVGLVHRTWRQARNQGFTDIANACFCYVVAMLGFLIAITFLANAYRFYLPAMIGLAISMSFVARRQMSANTTGDRHFAGLIPPQPIAVR
jgi:O-antigen ligase